MGLENNSTVKLSNHLQLLVSSSKSLRFSQCFLFLFMPKIVAIDFGLKRTGLAITDDQNIIASPLTTVESSTLMSFLTELTQRDSISTFVLGFPTRLDGSDTHVTQNVRFLKEALSKQFPEITVLLQDERFSSSRAMETIHLAGKKKQMKEKTLVDKLAATLILQDYLDQR
jgi:putative Holliday junction resolvase